MLRDPQRFSRQSYDLLVIGGGINGAAIANMAASHGLSVALVEKGDFASGTSSKSTKLIHGGLRYLEHCEFDLVRESLKERYLQLQIAPHLVKPIPFIIPVYANDRRPLWMMKLGVFLYDLLSGPCLIGKHRSLSPEQIVQAVPGVNALGLKGGVMYYDAQMDDARLCLENVLAADLHGAHAANYVEVLSFLKKDGKAVGVQAKDLLSGKVFEIRAQQTICAVGVWSDILRKKDDPKATPRLRPTKGIHLVYKHQLSNTALLIASRQDNRVFFVIPWMGQSLIGTTDTDYAGRPEDVQSDPEDVDYLIEEMRRVFPKAGFQKEDIVTTFAGLRPLVHEKGSPSKVSRQHVIEKTESGLIFVMGGKYTTYRKIAEDALSRFMPFKKGKTFSVYGSGNIPENQMNRTAHLGLSAEEIHHLQEVYGTRYTDVLALVEKNSQFRERLCSCSPAIKAQIVYAIETEMAQTPEDILFRRLTIGYRFCPTKQCRQTVEDFLTKKRTVIY